MHSCDSVIEQFNLVPAIGRSGVEVAMRHRLCGRPYVSTYILVKRSTIGR